MSAELDRKLKQYRISRSEYDLIKDRLGREPRGVEWALFSALWSEHCSYKSSKVHLRKLFNKSSRVVTAEGENAGVVDLGQGERVAFKMESHNHPSYIEPFEGAATGVGGILRDIFTMGARPIALANYLCFGEKTAPRMVGLIDGVVRGISSYGNCVGVPNITGQTEFHRSYNRNILVNALAVGLFRPNDPIVLSNASGPGNLVVYVGAKTGRDGIHGASMASESFDEKSSANKPTVQKGDPFYEKLLIESCLEVMRKNLVVAIQDMGAAGLTSSSFEMAAKGEVGLAIDLDRVPLRDSTLTPEDILLSESQERMLMIVEPKNFEAVREVFSRWDLDAETIGVVTKGPEIELKWHGEVVCKIDPKILVENAPRYDRPYTEWEPKNRVEKLQDSTAGDVRGSLMKWLKDPRGTARRWIYEQYDQRVGAKTVADCAEPIGVVQLPDSGRYLGLALGGRPHVMRTDAAVGGIDACAYPSLNLASKGFLPVALTDCLNYGNPENPNIMSEFVASLENMSKTCEALNVPVISGNVSFYNETLGENITSTPATGVVGLREEMGSLPASHFTDKRDEIYLLSIPGVELTGIAAEFFNHASQYTGVLHKTKITQFISTARHLALHPGTRATRVVGKFGLGYTLARMCRGGLAPLVKGFSGSLVNERLYEVVFVVKPEEAGSFKKFFAKIAANTQVSLQPLGAVREGDFEVNDVKIPVREIETGYATGWEDSFAGLS